MESLDSGISVVFESPSMRREWIEIQKDVNNYVFRFVSLHAEGVD